jgi:hypothetical protein
MPAPDDILKQNLSLLRRQDPELAERIEAAEPAALDWTESKAGPLTASLMHNDRPLWLASRYDPVKEAAKLVEGIEHDKSACVVVLGMGLGYHVAELARDMGPRGVLIVFEPDIGVWRAVMEKIDHRAWLCRGELILADGQTDRAALLKRTEKHAGSATSRRSVTSEGRSPRSWPSAGPTWRRRWSTRRGPAATLPATSTTTPPARARTTCLTPRRATPPYASPPAPAW